MANEQEGVRFSRRSFLKLGALGAAVVGTGAAVNHFTTEIVRTELVDIRVANLPKEFVDYRIGFVSDIHLGPFVPDEWVVTALDILNEHKIDLVLVGGDHINVPNQRSSTMFPVVRNKPLANKKLDELVEAVYTNLGKMLQLTSPPDGIWAVHGNHDRWLAPKIAEQILSDHGTPTLVNQEVEIKRGGSTLRLAGLDDYWTGIPKLIGPYKLERNREFRVVMTHNPDLFAEILRRTHYEFSLGVAGHTHAGQIQLKGVGPLTYNVRHPEFGEGLQEEQGTWLYTSRGIGVVEVPYRLNCPQEVTIFTLRAA